MKNLLTTFWPQILLLLVGIIAFATNYTPGTFLSGWDTLHPEFNFPLAFSRAIFGVFRPEQGVGAVAAHSHMADLPHIALLSLLSLFIPMSLLRYTFIFLCFIVGGLGMYAFLRHLIPSKATCLIGALFYMCNIGTVQNFYVPFEMFVVQYAVLPYLFLYATDFLVTQKKKALIGFVIAIILSSPIAFAATLWYVTFFIFLLYIVCLSISLKIQTGGTSGNPSSTACSEQSERSHRMRVTSRQDPLKSAFFLASLMLLLNLYWILPNIYFVLYHGKEVQQALTNQLFSEEAFLYNKTFSNFQDIATLHTFYFDWSMYANHGFAPLMQSWIGYLGNSLQTILGFSFFFVALLGILIAAVQKKKILLSLFPCLSIALIFLVNDNLPFHLYGLLEKIPLFQEAFRFPDDKILGIYVFIYSIFFSIGISSVGNFIKGKNLHTAYYILLATFLLTFSFPIFQGQLISPTMRVQIPKEYFQLFSHLDTQPQGRIATLPIQYLWGWEYYNWSYQGSGFLSFGIPQATMDRDYDRWNGTNETYYREMSYAIYTQNATLLKQVLAKYNISSILLDTSISDPTERKSALWYPATQKLLNSIGLTPTQFGNHLFLYAVGPTSSIVAFSHTLPIQPMATTDFVDKSFSENGDYTTNTIIIAPFSLTHLNNIQNTTTLANATIPFASYHLYIPSFLNTAAPSYNINDCAFGPLFPHTSALLWQKQVYFGYIRYISQDGSLCDHISFPYPLEGHNYILQITARNIQGLSLRICVSDPLTGKCVIYTKLPPSATFTTQNIFLPAFSGNKRFAVNINTIGIPGTKSVNDVKDIQILTAPIDTTPPTSSIQRLPIPSTTLANGSMFTFSSSSSHIALFTAFDPGWQLYRVPNFQSLFPFLFSQPIGQHTVIDNWANGWNLSNDQGSMPNDQFVIIFIPQYLEYFGFVVGGITILIIIRIHSKPDKFGKSEYQYSSIPVKQ